MFTMNCNGRLLVMDKPLVMGIINLTPDSFYSASRFSIIDEVLRKAEQMLSEGATLLDLGGQSTRPGSTRVDPGDELIRVMGPLEAVHKSFPESFISIDTFYAAVAREAVQAGASLVNDISAGTIDPGLVPAVASLRVPYVLMHMKGEPQTMQHEAVYEHIVQEVLDFFILKKKQLHAAGIVDLVIDPGFGFGKTIAHNFQLLHELAIFQVLDAPLLAGLSRKSTIFKTLDITATESLNGTTVLNTIALLNGASILRVHDVKEAVEAVKLVAAYRH